MVATPSYKDPRQPVAERVKDLLSRMTLAEKVGQMTQLDARGDLEEMIVKRHAGSLLHVAPDRMRPAIDLAAGTRLGIPLLIADDCIHGHSFWRGATIFPTQLAMSCAWDTDLLEKVARVTAIEATCTGFKWTFSPVLCLARDLRWGRINETFGEDPFLVGEFACAMVRGYQGSGLGDPTALLATAKHFAGYSETLGGRDASEADISRRKLKSWFLPPFERAARAGCRAFMTGYQSMDGVPSTANRWLLKETLKEQWGFRGILVTDWDNVGSMIRDQKICSNIAEAAALAIRCGNDLIMTTPSFLEGAQEAVARGWVAEPEIDEVVARILAIKFELGLFEDPGRPDPERQKKVIACAGHRDFNLEVARRSLVLLKNDGILPLSPVAGRTLAVVGPNADDVQSQLGDWAGASGQVEWMMDGHPREMVETVLDGLRAVAPAQGWAVRHAKGCEISLPADAVGVAEAVEACRSADAIVAVVGDNLQLAGEGKSTATLELQGGQQALLDALAATGKPLVVVLINSKPLVLPRSVREAAAIVEAFNPGMRGGRAVAELLFGLFEPSGRLTLSFPRHAGQLPVFYNRVRGQHGDRYADMTQEPLFAFGEGLSYTRFGLRDLRVLTTEVRADGLVEAEVTVANTGTRPGVHTVQVYIRDLVTSATWAEKELKAWRRVPLAPGESRVIRLSLPAAECSMVDAAGERRVEPGEFELLVGPDSRDANLLRGLFVIR